MKKLIRKIRMRWWKKHNPEKYYEEYWRGIAKHFTESTTRATASMAALARVLKEYNDKTTGEGQNLNGSKTNR